MATLHATLIHNLVNNLVVGVASTDMGVIVDYSCSRGPLYQAGTIKVLNRGASADVAHRFFGDDVGMSNSLSPITADISGGNIRLNVTVDNSTTNDINFHYNITIIKA